ncbi:MAG TPA: universal stress protein [Dactylosporangium sp.]|jgi:nucleotide-binding universal stress UspA family protein|nr:universal stress protein [Dactylosporangium sp.]
MGSEMPVVVGVDGSPEGQRAVEWAAKDALHRQKALRIVHAYVWPTMYAPIASHVAAPYESGMQEAAAEILKEAEERARVGAQGLQIETQMPVGQPAASLIAAAEPASVVVVGNRGRGGFAGLMLGSVGVALAAHAACPVVIVRRTDRPAGLEAGRVVVGMDGSQEAERALEFGFEEAEFRGTGLTALHAYDRDDEQRGLVETTSRWAEKYPDVDVRYHGVHGRPAEALADRSAGAELLVVGSRGRGGFAGLLLGSVSQATIHHAACPVAVIK